MTRGRLRAHWSLPRGARNQVTIAYDGPSALSAGPLRRGRSCAYRHRANRYWTVCGRGSPPSSPSRLRDAGHDRAMLIASPGTGRRILNRASEAGLDRHLVQNPFFALPRYERSSTGARSASASTRIRKHRTSPDPRLVFWPPFRSKCGAHSASASQKWQQTSERSARHTQVRRRRRVKA